MRSINCVESHPLPPKGRDRRGAISCIATPSLKMDVHNARRFVNRRRGFTLTESLIASVVLATSVIGVAGALSVSYQNSEGLDHSAMATALARQLLEEVTAKPYTDEDGSNEYRSIADYYDRPYTDATPGLTSRSGVELDVGGDAVFTRQVTVQYRLTPDGTDVQRSELAVVSVIVTPPLPAQAVTLSQLVTADKIEQ